MTSKDAFIQICKCSWVIIVNTWNSINKAAHKYPWAFILPIILITTAITIVGIGKARAERDYSNKKMIEMQMKLDTLQCVVENKAKLVYKVKKDIDAKNVKD